MKRYFWILIATLLVAPSLAGLQAQRELPENMEMRFEMLKKRFINERLELSAEEEDQFWPLYDAHHRKMDQLKEKYKQGENPMFLSDEEAERYLDNLIRFEEEALAERKNYMNELRNVLPVRKTLFLLHLEEQFKREMVQRIRNRLKDSPPAGPPKKN